MSFFREYLTLMGNCFSKCNFPDFPFTFCCTNSLLSGVITGIKKLFFYCIILFLLYPPVQSQQCTPFSVPYPNMGVNLPGATDLPWVNLWNQVNPWHSGYFSDPHSGNDLILGSDGWPIAGRTHRLVIGEDMNVIMTIPADTIKISFRGTYSQFSENDGNCSIVPGSQRNDYPEPGYAYLEVSLANPVVPLTQSGNHSIYAFLINGHVEDIKIMRPGFEINDNTLIHPDYMNLLGNFTTFRFMPYFQTNAYMVDTEYNCEGPLSVDWDERWNANAPQSCSGTHGGSWEIAVELCNQFDKDMWINVPVVASDDFVTEMAQMMRANLKPGLNINIEIGNETWNWGGGFCCSRQIVELCGGDGYCHMIWQAERLKQVVEIFASVWGWDEINNRIRGILCGQIGYGLAFYDLGWTIQNGLEYIQNTYNESPGRYFYAVGAAPYFGPQGDFSSVNNIINACQTDIDENIFGEFSNELWNGLRTGNKFDGWAKLAFENGMKIYCYEGGPDMDYTTGSGGAKDLAMRDPRMTDLCLDYWNTWYSRYGYNSLFCFFLAAFGNSGLYTLGEDFYTTSTRQEAINQITSNPAPDFDISRNVVDPLTGVLIDCRKRVAYMENWDEEEAAMYLHEGGELNYFIAATRNGSYSISIEHICATNSSIDIFLDGELIGDNVQLPTTSTVPGDWAFASYQWTAGQGVDIQFDMNYGVHLLKFHFNNENGNYRYIQANLILENPPAVPAAIQGDLTACIGSPNSSYTVELDGSVCEYEWEVAGGTILPPTGGNGAAVTGQGTNLIYVNWNGLPAGEYQIRVRGINDVGISLWQTDTVVLASCGFTANPNPVCIGSSVTFTPELAYSIVTWNWNFGAGAVPPASTAENPPPVTYSYPGNKSVQLVVTDLNGDSYTYVNEVIVSQTVAGTATATPTIINAGESSSINLTGQNGSVVNWEYSTDNLTWIPISAVQLPLNTGPLATSTWYRAMVYSAGCDTAVSTSVQVVVADPVNAGIITPAVGTICAGNTGPELILSGYDGTIVRWESRPVVGNWTTIAGATWDSYTPVDVSSTTSYRVIVMIGGTEYASQIATITVDGSVSAGTASASPTQICTGGTTVLILSNVTGTIQWQQSLDGSTNWTNITGANTASYETTAISNTIYFRAVVGGGGCPEVISNTVEISIDNTVNAGIITGNSDFCTGGTVPELTLTGYSGSLLQWQQSGNGTDFTDIINANMNNYTPVVYTGTRYFRVSVTQSGCTEVFSGSVQMNSTSGPVAEAGLDISRCDNSLTPIVMSGATATGSYSEATWTGGTGLGTWTQNIDPALATFTPTLNSGIFTATLTLTGSGGCEGLNSSSTHVISWGNIPDFSIASTNASGCDNNDGSIQLSGLLANTSYSISYTREGTAIGPVNMITDASGSIIIDNLNTGTYTDFIVDLNGCSASEDDETVISSLESPVITDIDFNDPDTCDGTGNIVISLENPIDGYSYFIDLNNDEVNEDSIMVVSGLLEISDLPVGTIINGLTVTDSETHCQATSLETDTIESLPLPEVDLSFPLEYCLGENIVLSGGTPGGGSYFINNIAYRSFYIFNTSELGVGIHSVRYEYTNADKCSNADTASLIINNLPVSEITGPLTSCAGASEISYQVNNNPDYQYVWNVINGNYTVSSGENEIAVEWLQGDSGRIELVTTELTTGCSDTSFLSIMFDDMNAPEITECTEEYTVSSEMSNGVPTYIMQESDTAIIPHAIDNCADNLNLSFSFNDSVQNDISRLVNHTFTESGNNILTWTIADGSGNTTTCNTHLIFELQRIAPSAFSPDGVPPNETWEINFLVNYPECTVSVYNRWGIQVYQSEKGYPEPWDGTSGGKLVPVDSYYFIIDYGDGSNPYRGYVSVLY